LVHHFGFGGGLFTNGLVGGNWGVNNKYQKQKCPLTNCKRALFQNNFLDKFYFIFQL